MNAKTLEAVRKHGQALLLAFPNATEQDPVALCKKLRRIETSLSKPLTDYCNGTFQDDEEGTEMDLVCAKATDRVSNLLGANEIMAAHFFVNRDPRGYALKLDDEWTRNYNFGETLRNNGQVPAIRIYTDMGGYGILAPDLTNP